MPRKEERLRNPVAVSAQAKRYRQKNKRYFYEYNKQWRKNNPVLVAEWRRRYKASHPEIIRQNRKNTKARRKGAVGKHSNKQWEHLKAIYNWTCPMCWKKEPEIHLTEDHKIPLSKDGTNYLDNIQPLCHSCNSKKGSSIWFAFCPLLKM